MSLSDDHSQEDFIPFNIGECKQFDGEIVQNQDGADLGQFTVLFSPSDAGTRDSEPFIPLHGKEEKKHSGEPFALLFGRDKENQDALGSPSHDVPESSGQEPEGEAPELSEQDHGSQGSMEEQSMEQGFQKGFEEGHAQGLDQGYAEGLEKGQQEGLARGEEEGFQKGMEKGEQQGFDAGREQGAEAARSEARKRLWRKSISWQNILLTAMNSS